LRKNIENRITELELNQNVILTGSLASDQVYEHYRTANVVVLASFSEGVPVVLMEAMGFGCTVIATQVGGVPELVKNGVTGLLVPPGNSQELASAIRWVQENPQQATALGRNAGEYVRKEFQLQTGVDQLISLFKQSVHSKN
jgi:glycosyltransferase involved in cell wall biosynthesis